MQLINHIGEKFELRILGNQLDDLNKPITWWYRSYILITQSGKPKKTKLNFLTQEDLFLLNKWLIDIYSGNYETTIFQFVDGHIWFRLWKKGRERFIRFFIQQDQFTKYHWDWRISLDKNNYFSHYVNYLLEFPDFFSQSQI